MGTVTFHRLPIAVLAGRCVIATTVKEEVRSMLDRMPDDLTWGRLADAVELRRKIARGLADAEAGRVTPHEEVRRLGFSE